MFKGINFILELKWAHRSAKKIQDIVQQHWCTCAMGGMLPSVHSAASGLVRLSACRSTFRRYDAKSALSLSEASKSLRLEPAMLQPNICSNFFMSPDICQGNMHRPRRSTTHGSRISKLPRRMEIIPRSRMAVKVHDSMTQLDEPKLRRSFKWLNDLQKSKLRYYPQQQEYVEDKIQIQNLPATVSGTFPSPNVSDGFLHRTLFETSLKPASNSTQKYPENLDWSRTNSIRPCGKISHKFCRIWRRAEQCWLITHPQRSPKWNVCCFQEAHIGDAHLA